MTRLTTPESIKYPCFTCGGTFRFGPHVYDGHHVSAYRINVCSGCWGGNWDGWAPHYEPRLLAHLVAEGLAVPERNASGYLPRNPTGPDQPI